MTDQENKQKIISLFKKEKSLQRLTKTLSSGVKTATDSLLNGCLQQLEEWNALEWRYFPNIAPRKTKTENLIYLLQNNTKTSLGKIFSAFGVHTLLSDMPAENLKKLLKRFRSSRIVREFFNTCKQIKFTHIANHYFEEIKTQINNWLPIKFNLATAGQII